MLYALYALQTYFSKKKSVMKERIKVGVLGAAGASILNAELLVALGRI